MAQAERTEPRSSRSAPTTTIPSRRSPVRFRGVHGVAGRRELGRIERGGGRPDGEIGRTLRPGRRPAEPFAASDQEAPRAALRQRKGPDHRRPATHGSRVRRERLLRPHHLREHRVFRRGLGTRGLPRPQGDVHQPLAGSGQAVQRQVVRRARSGRLAQVHQVRSAEQPREASPRGRTRPVQRQIDCLRGRRGVAARRDLFLVSRDEDQRSEDDARSDDDAVDRRSLGARRRRDGKEEADSRQAARCGNTPSPAGPHAASLAPARRTGAALGG